MTPEMIAVAMFGGLVVLLLLGVPLPFVGGGIAAAVILYLWGEPGFFLVIAHVWGTMGSFTMVAVPMFIFMANVLQRAGVGEELFQAVFVWMGPIRGSLAVATIIASAIIAAMVGIIGAGIVMMGLIALPAMLKRGYSKRLALGVILAGGCLGQLIPPSVMFIVYAMVAGVSVGALFLGGAAAGLILVVLYIAYILVRCYLQPQMGPPALKEERMIPLGQKLARLKGLIIPICLMVAVLGTIFFGIATPTEASGVGALGAIVSAATRRRLTWNLIKDSLYQTVRATCMIAWIFFSVGVFAAVFLLAGAGRVVADTIVGLPLTPFGIVVSMQLFFLILGVPMDWLGNLMIAGPIFIPIIEDLGFCAIWFGVLFNLNMQIAWLSPPVGTAMFYLKGVSPADVTMGDIFLAALPFLAVQFICLLIVLFFPQSVMWLPNLLL